MFVEWIQDWGLLLLPATVLIINQFLKITLGAPKNGFDIKRVFAYGGMPSGHTAFFTSVSTIIGLTQGFQSGVFAIAFVVSIVVIRDAMGLRRAIGVHGKAINNLLKNSKEKKEVNSVQDVLGHTPLEVVAGAVIGIGITFLLYLAVY